MVQRKGSYSRISNIIKIMPYECQTIQNLMTFYNLNDDYKAGPSSFVMLLSSLSVQ